MAPRAATHAARDCLQCHATPYGDTVIVVDVAMEFNDAPIWLVPCAGGRRESLAPGYIAVRSHSAQSRSVIHSDVQRAGWPALCIGIWQVVLETLRLGEIVLDLEQANWI